MSVRPPAPETVHRSRRPGAVRLVILLAVPLGMAALGCATASIPDPQVTAARYAHAVRSKDGAAVYSMLNDRSRARYGERGVKELLADAPKELATHAGAVATDRATIEAQGELRYESGLVARVRVENGQTYVDAAGMLPLIPRSPESTLREFRAALQGRSYHALLRLLAADARAELDAELDGLVEALREPETLDVRVVGDTATVDAPGGHRVTLRKENGVWLVVDFQ